MQGSSASGTVFVRSIRERARHAATHARSVGHAFRVALVALAIGCGGPQIPPHPRPLVIADPEQAVAAFYRRLNAEDLEGVLALMTREPVLVEPFSSGDGSMTSHHGYHDVATFFAESFRTRDDQVVPEFIRAEGDAHVEVGWSMHGSDGSGVSGQSHLEMSHGLIARIVIQPRD
jgi:hypothetical protein